MNPHGFVTQEGVKDKLIVIYCHHTLASMGMEPFQRGYWLEHLLLRFPNVIMVVNGHTHANDAIAHFYDVDERTNRNGFWEINTASAIDWPVQSRLIEVAYGAGTAGDVSGTGNIGIGYGMLSIFTTMLDIDAPLFYHEDVGVTHRRTAQLMQDFWGGSWSLLPRITA